MWMKKTSNLIKISKYGFSSFCVVALMAGCSSKQHKIESVPISVKPSDNPSEQIASLEQAFSESRSRNVPILAPTWYSQAHDSFSEAKKIRENSNDSENLFKMLAEARIELTRANEIAKTSEKALSDVMAARQSAIRAKIAAKKAGAVDLKEMEEDFAEADKQLVEVTEDIEKDKLDKAVKEKDKLIARYIRSEKQAAKKESLDMARRTIEEAKKQNAKKYAPTTLSFAEETLERAEKYINNHPLNKQEISNLGDEALIQANKALKTTLEAKSLVEKGPEQTVLGNDDKMSRMRREVGSIAAEAEENKGAADRDSQEEAARKIFQSSEAQVLREGSKTIIRLKGLNFRVGQSGLAEENFVLLDKVKTAIKLFDGSKINVQGHTDSTGNEANNLKLSEERARAVKKYLVANRVVAEEDVSSVGKGINEPIAQNATPEGRAANRRVDIIFEVPTTPVE